MSSPSDTAKVQCACGHEFRVPSDEVGMPVECPVCGAEFVARAVAEDAAETSQAPRQPLGKLAVERGLVSQEHLDLCVEYQRALRSAVGQPQKRLGQILVDKGLLKPQQVERLLSEQRGEAVRKRPAPVPAALRPPEPTPEAPRPRRKKAALRRLGYALALLVLGGLVALAVVCWPRAGASETLAAYLESCRGRYKKPDARLGSPTLGLVVRHYRIEEVYEPTTWDYSSELRLFQGQKRSEWPDFLDIVGVDMPPPKREALAAAVVLMPAEVKPRGLLSLTITLQPITCGMQYRGARDKFFRSGACRFLLVRVKTPRWSCPWRVASVQEIH